MTPQNPLEAERLRLAVKYCVNTVEHRIAERDLDQLLALIEREKKKAVEEAFERLAKEDGWMRDDVVQIPYRSIMNAMFPTQQ